MDEKAEMPIRPDCFVASFITDKEKKVILLYYYEELTLKEISSVLEVSESRISQLHTKALQKMKVKLGSVAANIFSNMNF